MIRINYPYIFRRRYVQLFLLEYAVLFDDDYTDFKYQANLELYKHRSGLCFHRFFIYSVLWKEILYIDFRSIRVKSVLDYIKLNNRNYPYYSERFGTFKIIKRKSLLTLTFPPRIIPKKSNLIPWVVNGYGASHYWTIFQIKVVEVNDDEEKIFLCTNCEELYWINKFFLPIVIDV